MLGLKVGLVVVALIALIGAYAMIDSRGYDRGRSETMAEVAQRDNEALRASIAAHAAAQARVRDLEAQSVRSVAQAGGELAQRMEVVRVENALLRADLAAGRVRLVDPGRAAEGDRGAAAEACTATGGGDGAGAGGFSASAAGFLLGEAERADRIAARLAAAQAVILSDREVCR
ncbi:MAG: lysis protein [Burkholderiales bacterium]|nr:lysis protein [Burkholderiales bacterium]